MSAANDPNSISPPAVEPSAPPPPPGPIGGVTAPSPTLGRELAIDSAIRWLVVLALFGAIAALSIFWDALPSSMSSVAAVAIAGLWIMWGSFNARAVREIPRISMLLDQDPEAAEAAINAALRKHPLTRSARMLLYHRLAVLRYRQRRLPELAAICRAMLSRRLGAAAAVRGHLLLMLAEADLENRNLSGAYASLMQLRRVKLSLLESLQRLTLQTRYEIACGYHRHALERLDQKIKLIELMPGAECGQMHALLATAASGARQPKLADWLRRRAELLCTPQQLAELGK